MTTVTLSLSMSLDGFVAVVVGRNTFEVSERWGGKGPFGAPTFVVTHSPPTKNRGEFTHVTEGVEAAIEQARAAAGEKDVSVMGAIVPRQAIRAGLVDAFVIHLIPVLLGAEGVTHLRFRVVR